MNIENLTKITTEINEFEKRAILAEGYIAQMVHYDPVYILNFNYFKKTQNETSVDYNSLDIISLLTSRFLKKNWNSYKRFMLEEIKKQRKEYEEKLKNEMLSKLTIK